MNMFQIDFVQGKTDAANYGTIVHSLIDTASDRQIITLALSPDKLQSVSTYAREPKRLSFECFRDAWIDEYILSGNYEHIRNISHYEVKCYRDDVLIFTGIIDTSQIKDDGENQPLQVLCYDKIKLFSLFSDITQLYSLLSGYSAAYVLGYYKQKIEAAIPISLPISTAAFAVPSIYITGATYATMIPLISWDLSEMNTLPPNTGGFSYEWNAYSYVTPKAGYIVYEEANHVIFFLAHLKVIKATSGEYQEQYKARYKAAIVRYFNNICAKTVEITGETEWGAYQHDVTDAAFLQFFVDNGFAAEVFVGLPSSVTLLTRTNFQWYYTNNIVTSVFRHQVLPLHLHPGLYYTKNEGTELTPCIKVLQAMLMLYNATLVAAASGTVALVNKQPTATDPIAIADSHIVSFSRSRERAELPDTSILEVLAGDTTILQGMVKDYLLQYAGFRWKANITIDNLNAYALSLHSYIIIRDVHYYIVELGKDYINDEYNVIAWQSE